MYSKPVLISFGLFKLKNNEKKAELRVVAKANPIFLDKPIRPETILTSCFGAEFITEVPFETVKIVNDPAAKFCSQCSLGLDEKTILEYDKQKDQTTKMGLGIIESSQNTQDKINQALLDELKMLKNEITLLKNKK